MRQQVRIVCDDGSELEVNFNCGSDLTEEHRIAFLLRPPGPTEFSRIVEKQTDESFGAPTPVGDEPAEFVIRVWKYKGYLIVEYERGAFSIYDLSGNCCGYSISVAAAREEIDGLADKPKKGLRP